MTYVNYKSMLKTNEYGTYGKMIKRFQIKKNILIKDLKAKKKSLNYCLINNQKSKSKIKINSKSNKLKINPKNFRPIRNQK